MFTFQHTEPEHKVLKIKENASLPAHEDTGGFLYHPPPPLRPCSRKPKCDFCEGERGSRDPVAPPTPTGASGVPLLPSHFLLLFFAEDSMLDSLNHKHGAMASGEDAAVAIATGPHTGDLVGPKVTVTPTQAQVRKGSPHSLLFFTCTSGFPAQVFLLPCPPSLPCWLCSSCFLERLKQKMLWLRGKEIFARHRFSSASSPLSEAPCGWCRGLLPSRGGPRRWGSLPSSQQLPSPAGSLEKSPLCQGLTGREGGSSWVCRVNKGD